MLPADLAAGMGGAPFEELVDLAAHGYGDAVYAVVCMLNDGSMHPDVWDVLEQRCSPCASPTASRGRSR
eukprot:6086362-Prymnesium_polylepis.1